MDFFVYSRDAEGTALRDDMELLERHWSYMDDFAGTMIARGPTLSDDRETATGSLHVLGLPGVDAAREFVTREPNNLAGVYAEHAVYRFDNLLSRTMWEFRGAADEPRFLIIGRFDRDRQTAPTPVDRLSPVLCGRLIIYGTLSALDDGDPVGVALAVEASDPGAVATLLNEVPTGFGDIEIHHWEFGGRR